MEIELSYSFIVAVSVTFLIAMSNF